ncbi:hypothetical protein J6590_073121 [Homalodisca vitripennis]|nr:hypothetical protein J6590_073121 [Homalodisca vitripennis]
MAQCSGYNGYRKITGSNNVERGCWLDPVLASSPPTRPLVVVRKSPLSRWPQGNDPDCRFRLGVRSSCWKHSRLSATTETGLLKSAPGKPTGKTTTKTCFSGCNTTYYILLLTIPVPSFLHSIFSSPISYVLVPFSDDI